MNSSNKKKLLETFTALPNCPNCNQPSIYKIWTLKEALADDSLLPIDIDQEIKYSYCHECLLTPDQVTQVKAFFNEWI
jgi:hypothetical protein